MLTNRKYLNTDAFKDYKGKSISEFDTFAEKITCARVNYNNGKSKKKGLSLTEAAESIGISTMHLSYLEKGKRKVPNAILLHNIEQFYKFKPGELVELLQKENSKEKKIS